MSNPDSNLNPHTYTMNGVEVSFPAKAYPSQVAMMSKVGIQFFSIGYFTRQNVLSESLFLITFILINDMIIKMIHFIGLPDFSRHNIPKYTK
jgi:hypothetical protein